MHTQPTSDTASASRPNQPSSFTPRFRFQPPRATTASSTTPQSALSSPFSVSRNGSTPTAATNGVQSTLTGFVHKNPPTAAVQPVVREPPSSAPSSFQPPHTSSLSSASIPAQNGGYASGSYTPSAASSSSSSLATGICKPFKPPVRAVTSLALSRNLANDNLASTQSVFTSHDISEFRSTHLPHSDRLWAIFSDVRLSPLTECLLFFPPMHTTAHFLEAIVTWTLGIPDFC